MNPHISAAFAAAAVAAAVSLGVSNLTRPPQVVTVNTALPPTEVTPAKLRHIVATTWPEMEQREIDALTAAAKEIGGTVMIFCHEESKCGDLALNLENAFESAHWATSVHMIQNLPEGMSASTKEMAAMLNAATGARYDVGIDENRSAPGNYIVIGRRKRAS